jgi:hypothetical protein
MNQYPLIYISALPRTGSTLLSELFTDLPYSFILHEPHLGKNYFAAQALDKSQLARWNIDIDAFLKFRLPIAFCLRRLRRWGYRQDDMMRAFKYKLLPQLQANIQQIGVKEIKHMGWENYARHFPNMKVIVTGREPRDLYLSLYQKFRRGSMVWQGKFNPRPVARKLRGEFQRQLALKKSVDTMFVKYRDLCRDETTIKRVKAFVRSPIPHTGEVGSFIANHPRRAVEHHIHRGRITDKRIGRWQKETDDQLLSEINTFYHLMPEYCEFWGYIE